MYEEHINKLEERIRKLTHDLGKKNMKIEELNCELLRTASLKEEIETVARLYEETELKFSEHELDWQKWKQNWLAEKQ